MSVLLLNAYAGGLVVLRGRIWGLPVYRPMLVNIALSPAPVVVALVLPLGLAGLVEIETVAVDAGAAASQQVFLGFWAYLILVSAVWLLALPNSAELNVSHRRSTDPVPLWYHIVATLTVSGIATAVLGLG